MVLNETGRKLLKLFDSLTEEQAEAICGVIESLTKEKSVKQNESKGCECVSDPYEQNGTMQLIGYQTIGEYQNNMKCVDDILTARGMAHRYNTDNSFYGAITDVFMYGVITGKRQERQKKKANAQLPTKAMTSF